MSNTYDNDNNRPGDIDYGRMFKEIERAYGFDVAREVFRQINRVVIGGDAPDFLVVKACSEMMELFAGQTKTLVTELRQDRENRELAAKVDTAFNSWWVAMKLHYRLHSAALVEFQKPKHSGQPSVSHQNK